MQFTNYFFVSVISFSGLIIGILLVKAAPEEQKPLEKYFMLMKRIMLLLIFAFLAVYYFNDYYNLAVLAAFFVLAVFSEYKISELYRKTAATYLSLGALSFLSSRNINLFAIGSSLIFLYGMAAASLMYNIRGKNHYKAIFYSSGFVVIANLLYLINYHFGFTLR